ncbi:ABC transporter ATP-binding protein [Vibrio salinus]|uniref:ABC transporter ATP-binding protein n=1 Tax=Vibrio salinus TaxID=2899784 RepID=UPI001E284891|nr:ABC transporter ATP-binding protein [Vibrio salinus]MCE0495536.1 ABC transporter ATP-binding protein [Vibrio salinus]
MPTITLNQLQKTYPGAKTAAVKGIDLTVKDGEFMCLLGPSGCGKTTILRMIAGIEHATGGEIAIDDKVMDSVAKSRFVPPEQRGIGLVFQNYALWPHMTVEQNVEFGLKLKKIPKEERHALSQDVMEKLRIADYANRYPSQLSGGQQQRVALARMLAVNPGVLLLDEPLSNLDAALRLEMRAELRRLHQTFGTTIIFVSHDQWEAMTLATTIAVMSNGELQQVGTPDDIYATPGNRFVAEFIGTPKLNMMELHRFQPQNQLAAQICHRFEDAHRARVCGIRPESIILHTTPAPGTTPMVVDNIMPTGGSWVVEIRQGQTQLFHSTQIKPDYQAGDPVFCELPGATLHFFDEEGERLSLSEIHFTKTSAGFPGVTSTQPHQSLSHVM